MYYRIDAIVRQSCVYHCCDCIDTCRQHITEECTDDIECQIENQEHHTNEDGDGKEFVSQYAVDTHTSHMFLTFLRLDNCFATYRFNKVITHIRQSCVSVHIMFFFHLDDTVFQQFQFVLVQFQFFCDGRIFFDQFCCRKTDGDTCFFRMVFNLVAHRVDTSVNRTGRTEVIYFGIFFLLCHTNCDLHQFIDTLIFHRTDGNNGDTQFFGHFLHVDSTAIVTHFVHHVQRQYHGDMHFDKLQCQVQVSFNICCINDIDDTVGFFIQNKVPCYDFFRCIGTDGIDTGQVYHRAILFSTHFAHFLVYSYAGKVTNMLIRACQLIEQGSFAAVLIACQCKDHALPSSVISIFFASSIRIVSV